MSVIDLKTEWRTERRAYLGGTDVAALVGLNKYKTPLGVFLSKRGEVDDTSGVKAEMGVALEPLIKAMFARETGLTVHDAPPHIKHKDYDFLGGNLDGICAAPEVDFTYEEGLLECKTYDYNTADEWGEEWTDEIPKVHYCQCTWYLGLTGETLCYVAALHRTTGSFKIYKVKFNKVLYLQLVHEGVKFWNKHILTGIEPEVQAGDLEYLREIHPTDTGGMLIGDADAERWASEMKAIKAEIEPLNTKFNTLKALMVAKMGDNSILATMEGNFTYRQSKATPKTDWKLVYTGIMTEFMAAATKDKPTPNLIKLVEIRDTLLNLYTVTKPGTRRFLTPFSKEE